MITIKPIIIIKHNTHIYIRVQGGFREGSGGFGVADGLLQLQCSISIASIAHGLAWPGLAMARPGLGLAWPWPCLA